MTFEVDFKLQIAQSCLPSSHFETRLGSSKVMMEVETEWKTIAL